MASADSRYTRLLGSTDTSPAGSPQVQGTDYADGLGGSFPRPAETEVQVTAGRWWHQQDIDGFFKNVYHHYDAKGLMNIVAKGVLDHLRVVFVVFIILLMTVVIDYNQLNNHIENKCPGNNHSQLTVADCHGNVPIDFGRLIRMPWPVYIVLLVILVVWMWSFVIFLAYIPRCIDTRDFFEQELRINTRRVQTVSWDAVVERLIEAQQRLQLCTAVKDFDELDITNLITRQRNFHIALYRELGPRLTVHLPFMKPRVIVSDSLRWNIEQVLNRVIFDGNHLDPAVFSEYPNEHAKLAAGLRWRFQWFGVVNVLLSPGILLIRLAYFIFHNSDSLRKSTGVLAARQWSPYACYLLRNYSEVEHVFRQRLAQTLEPSNRYVNLFVSESVTIAARFVVFVVGGFFVALTILGFIYDEDFLFANLVLGRSVIWWTGMLGLVLAASQAAIPKDDLRPDFAGTLAEVTAASGYVPDQWKGEEENLETFDEFTALFQLKGVTFLEELLSILILTPYILIFRLPHESDFIVQFFKARTYRHPHLGDFCKYACFHPANTEVELSQMGEGSTMGGAAAESQYWGERSHHTEGSFARESYATRLDHSIATFKRQHPNWRPERRPDRMHMSASCSELPEDEAAAGAAQGHFGLPPTKLHIRPDEMGDSQL